MECYYFILFLVTSVVLVNKPTNSKMHSVLIGYTIFTSELFVSIIFSIYSKPSMMDEFEKLFLNSKKRARMLFSLYVSSIHSSRFVSFRFETDFEFHVLQH